MAQPFPAYGVGASMPVQGFNPQVMQQHYDAWQQYYAQLNQQASVNPTGYDAPYNPQPQPLAVNKVPGPPVYNPAGMTAYPRAPEQWPIVPVSDAGRLQSYNAPQPLHNINYLGNRNNRNGSNRWNNNERPGAGSGPGGHGYNRGPDVGSAKFNGVGGLVESKNTIFVSGLPQSANEQFINDVFNAQGEIEVSEYNGKPKIKVYQDHGVSKGECTVTFRSEETARKVVETLNGQFFPGSDNRMEISYAKFNNDTRPSFNNRNGYNNQKPPPLPLLNTNSGFRGGYDNGRAPLNKGFNERDNRPPRGRDDRERNNRDRKKRNGGNAEVRPNDWVCVCGNNNFSFRTECNSCHVPRPANGGIPSLVNVGRRDDRGPRGRGFSGNNNGMRGPHRGPPRDSSRMRGPLRFPPRGGGREGMRGPPRGPPRDGSNMRDGFRSSGPMRGPPRLRGEGGGRHRPY